MSSSNEQDGSQPPVTTQSPKPASPVGKNKKKEICRKFVWGTCNKGAACKFRHELDFEKVKETVIFCHDYQNRSGCTRENCTYLHTTKEEQNLFYATGKLPKILADRHANISAETIPQIAMFIKETLMGASPPAAVTAQSTMPVVGPMPPPPLAGPMYPPGMAIRPGPPMMATPVLPPCPPPGPPPGPALPGPLGPPGHPCPPPSLGPSTVPIVPVMPIQHLPPPPPPPTQNSATVTQPTPPVYTAPTNPSGAFHLNQPPPAVPAKFDASKPPPPLLQVQNGTLKRPASSDLEAGPSKVRKEDDSNISDSMCDTCKQRQIRIKAIEKEIEILGARQEYYTVMFKKKMEEYNRNEEIFKSLVNPVLFGLLMEGIEGNQEGSQIHDLLNQSQSYNNTNDSPLLMQVLDFYMNNHNNSDSKQATSPRIEERFNTLFTQSKSVPHSKADLLSLLEKLCGENDEKKTDVVKATLSSSSNNNNSSSNQVYPNGLEQAANSRGSKVKTCVASTPVTSYPVYNAPPPPISRAYAPTAPLPLPNTSMASYSQQNGVPSTQTLVSKPGLCVVPPPPPTNNLRYPSYNTGPYPPPTPYYNPYQ
ncbi:protein diaphanous homolog 2-like isoform X2 [Colias croceus]|nr:protein diaphanous homolog 2-like isoform X2 [Colias croceus]